VRSLIALLTLSASIIVPQASADPCGCSVTIDGLPISDLVFRGTMLNVKRLSEIGGLLGRLRYATTFRIDQYWAGSPSTDVITLYDLAPGRDCLRFEFEIGKEYLVFAIEGPAWDVRQDDAHLALGSPSLLAPDTPALQLAGCAHGRPTSDEEVQGVMSLLGAGKVPPYSDLPFR
jgi:hypothetical protein